MRVVFVIPYFYPAWEYGGQPRSAFELARGLVQRGHQVKVLTTDSGGHRRVSDRSSAECRELYGIEAVYYRNISNALAYHDRIFLPLQFFRTVREEIRAADIVHIHELRSTLAVPTYRAAWSQSIPYVVSPHGGLRHLGKSTVKGVYDALWGRRILDRAAAVFAISPSENADAEYFKVPARRIKSLPNGIQLEQYEQPADSAEFRRRWRVEDKCVVLFLGRLHHLKGADLLIRAFKLVHASRPDVHLIVAGPDDGAERDLRKLASDAGLENCITFTGFLDQHAKRAAYAASNLFVIPSRSEVFALTAVESLLSQTPVLMSSACGLYPLPDEGVAIFQSENVEALATAICSLTGSTKRLDPGNTRRFVERHFSTAAVAAIAEAAYMEALTQK